MIDDDDAMFATLIAPGGLIGLLIVIAFWWAACHNKEECSQRKCDTGAPVLLKGECLCVEKVK